MLVRPNVAVDPIWEELTASAKLTAPSNARARSFGIGGLGSAFAANHRRKVSKAARKDRQRRDADIAGADEYEIPTEQKVILLVSSSLNDGESLPGHVFRCLIREHRLRSRRKREMSSSYRGKDKKGDRIREPLLALTDEVDGAALAAAHLETRSRRQDCHGVIKHATATLLEVRPGFGSSARLAERSATTVEAWTFGQLYDDVFAEIREECREVDAKLMKKIAAFDMLPLKKGRVWGWGRREGRTVRNVAPLYEEEEEYHDAPNEETDKIRSDDISVGALEALLSLPDGRTPVDKLGHCVRFLERISVHFSGGGDSGGRQVKRPVAAGADNLLKMVCEHIIVAKVRKGEGGWEG